MSVIASDILRVQVDLRWLEGDIGAILLLLNPRSAPWATRRSLSQGGDIP